MGMSIETMDISVQLFSSVTHSYYHIPFKFPYHRNVITHNQQLIILTVKSYPVDMIIMFHTVFKGKNIRNYFTFSSNFAHFLYLSPFYASDKCELAFISIIITSCQNILYIYKNIFYIDHLSRNACKVLCYKHRLCKIIPDFS